jgi:hypothetical protein
MEPSRNTDGSSGRPVMSAEPNESSAKSVLTEVTRSNQRVSRTSELSFNKTDGNPSGLRENSSHVPSASKKWKNRSVYLYPTFLSNPRPTLLTLFKHRPLPHRPVEVYSSPRMARSSLNIHILMCLTFKNSNFLFCGGGVRVHPANLDRQFFRVTEDPLALMNLGRIILLPLRSLSCHISVSCI